MNAVRNIVKFTNFSQILTLFALVLAIWQTWLAIEAQRGAVQQTEQLKQIEESLSTRYLGKFPNYVDDIAELIGSAETSLDFFYDVPGYGVLSSPNSWTDMKYSIIKKRNAGIPINVALYSSQRRQNVIEEQFGFEDKRFYQWIRSPDVSKKVNDFLKRNNYKERADNITSAKYVEISMEVQDKILNDLFNSDSVQNIDELMPIYFWIVDDLKAIFVIPSFSENSGEIAFFTSDASMIKALKEMRNRYVKMTN